MEVKSFRGQSIDMERLRMQNEKQVALGNAGTNARGDKLGKGGKIIQTNEERVKEYYQKNPQPVQQVSIHEDPMARKEELLKAEQEALAATREDSPVRTKASKKIDADPISQPHPVQEESVAENAANDETIKFN